MADIRRILVTGGAGFIGSNYVHYLRAHAPEHEVVVLDKLTYAGNMENLDDVLPEITFIQGDIAESADVEKAMPGVDAVVNFAAESHVDRSLIDPRPFIRTNVEGTVVLLEAARKSGARFLQVSTDEVYGDLAGSNHHSLESDPPAPRSPYAASKAAAEHLVFSYGISYGLPVLVTRGSNTYGPYQYPEKILSLFITNLLEDKPLPLYGDGSAVRDYLHVEDHAAGIDLVLSTGTPGQAYNLGARNQTSGLELARALLTEMGKSDSLLRFVADRPGHDYRYSIDPSKAEALGWQRQWDITRGLAQTVRWYREHEGWWRRVKEKAAFRQHEQAWYVERV